MTSTARRRAGGGVVALLLLVVVAFAMIRLLVDVPHLVAGTMPSEDSFERRYVEHPVPAYLHILPGTLFLVAAPLQLSSRFRRRHLRLHRRLGRVLLTVGLLSGVFSLVFGAPRAFGGWSQAVAATVFGTWFLVTLVLAYAAIRRHDVAAHRRWMVRAFAVALAVGTIRLWVGLFQLTGVLGFREGFGPAFWLGLTTHVLVGEWWLRTHPAVPGRREAPASRESASRRWLPHLASRRLTPQTRPERPEDRAS